MYPDSAVKALVHLLFRAIRGIQYMFHSAQHYKKALFRIKIESMGASDENTERTEEEQMASMREHINFPVLKDSQDARDSWIVIYDKLFQNSKRSQAWNRTGRHSTVNTNEWLAKNENV